MNIHKNARLTPLGRERMVRIMLSGQTRAGTRLEVGPGQSWREVSPDKTENVQAAERDFIEFANAFGERWRNRLAECTGADRCGQCAYYRGLSGGYDFWDFGVCANADSNLDGQLVSVKSGCDSFSVKFVP